MQSREGWRIRYKVILVSMLIIVLGMLSAAGLMVMTAVPYGQALVTHYTGEFAAACGCTDAVPFAEQPLLAIGVVVLGTTVVLGIAAAIIRSVVLTIRTKAFRHNLRQSIISQTVSRGIPIYRINSSEPIAVSVGIIRSEVYVSTGLQEMLEPWELWAVIRHELDHAENNDPRYRFISMVLQPFFPFAQSFF